MVQDCVTQFRFGLSQFRQLHLSVGRDGITISLLSGCGDWILSLTRVRALRCAHSLSLSLLQLACRVPDGEGDPGSDGLHGGHGRVLLERRRLVHLKRRKYICLTIS